LISADYTAFAYSKVQGFAVRYLQPVRSCLNRPSFWCQFVSVCFETQIRLRVNGDQLTTLAEQRNLPT